MNRFWEQILAVFLKEIGPEFLAANHRWYCLIAGL